MLESKQSKKTPQEMTSFSRFMFIIFCLHMIKPTKSDQRATEAALICTNRTASTSDRQNFVPNFIASLDALTPQIASQKYGKSVNGSGNTTVYAFGECFKDLSNSDCNLCFAQIKTQILRCLPFQRLIRGGRIYFDGCFLRYDDYDFVHESLSVVDKTVCGSKTFLGNQTVFKNNVVELVRNLSVEAPQNDGFRVGFVNRGNLSVYGLAQCWEFVSKSDCVKCLAKTATNISLCPPNDEGRVLNAGCYLRYSTQKFYNNSTAIATGSNNGSSRLAVILASISSAIAFILILAAAAFILNKRVAKKRRETKQLGALLATVNKSKLNFSYETLEKATNYFNNANKLGQGGSGSVYKGTLPDGKVVAIKRLFFNTRQWVDHFFNEVNLISDIEHKNLVKLLGCSIAGPESLLVYEYVPNHSLQDYIFGKGDVQLLSWEVRYSIILGTAEGLAYLHEESKLRIIHRDIKLSNVLLDENLNAKIADFGLARLFPEDKTHITTAIAGTLGYMAPEYVVRGILTEKADVYSFGVLLIEVVSGKRINFFTQNASSILQMVWNLYSSDKLCEAVDLALKGKFNIEEAYRILKIGLLCVQASPELRPAMSVVVKMLNNDHELAQPTQPPFLNTSVEGMKPFLAAPPPPQINYDSLPGSQTQSSGNSMTQSLVEPR